MSDWTGEKNRRRCNLIDAEVAGCISPREYVELQQLQREMLAHRNANHPLPIAEARDLHEKLEPTEPRTRRRKKSNVVLKGDETTIAKGTTYE